MFGMFGKRENEITDTHLDRFGRAVVGRAAADESTLDAVASNGFLYARVRFHIAAERERMAAGESWLNLFSVARRAVPVMGLSAAIAFGAFWFGNSSVPFSATDDDTLFAANDSSVEQVLFADREALSSGEVFDTLIGDEEAEVSR